MIQSNYYCPECHYGGLIVFSPGESQQRIDSLIENDHAENSPLCKATVRQITAAA